MLRYCPLSGVKKYTPKTRKPMFHILGDTPFISQVIPDAAKTARERGAAAVGAATSLASVLHTDRMPKRFGRSGRTKASVAKKGNQNARKKHPWHGQPFGASITLAPLRTAVPVRADPARKC